jgi:hypothetical protein
VREATHSFPVRIRIPYPLTRGNLQLKFSILCWELPALSLPLIRKVVATQKLASLPQAKQSIGTSAQLGSWAPLGNEIVRIRVVTSFTLRPPITAVELAVSLRMLFQLPLPHMFCMIEELPFDQLRKVRPKLVSVTSESRFEYHCKRGLLVSRSESTAKMLRCHLLATWSSVLKGT